MIRQRVAVVAGIAVGLAVGAVAGFWLGPRGLQQLRPSTSPSPSVDGRADDLSELRATLERIESSIARHEQQHVKSQAQPSARLGTDAGEGGRLPADGLAMTVEDQRAEALRKFEERRSRLVTAITEYRDTMVEMLRDASEPNPEDRENIRRLSESVSTIQRFRTPEELDAWLDEKPSYRAWAGK